MSSDPNLLPFERLETPLAVEVGEELYVVDPWRNSPAEVTQVVRVIRISKAFVWVERVGREDHKGRFSRRTGVDSPGYPVAPRRVLRRPVRP